MKYRNKVIRLLKRKEDWEKLDSATKKETVKPGSKKKLR